MSGSITVQSGGSLYDQRRVPLGLGHGHRRHGVDDVRLERQRLHQRQLARPAWSQLGGPPGSGCAGNKISSSVTLSGNTAGVTAVGNTISGSVTVSSNKGGVLFSGNKVSLRR